MEFENNINPHEDNSSITGLHLREQIEKYIRYWKWFLLAVFITFLYTFYSLNFQRRIFEAHSTIKIKNERQGDKSALSALGDMGIMGGTSKNNIDDEIEVLQSKSLIAEAIIALNLNVEFLTDKNYLSKFLDNNLGMNTKFYEIENYENPPLKINFFISDSALYEINSEFIITINSPNKYTFSNTKKSIVKTQSFGEKITTNFGDIIILPNVDLRKNNLIGSDILVSITSVKTLAKSYALGLAIEPIAEFSNVLKLAASDSNRKRAEDFLDKLVEMYNERSITLKKELTKSTSDFVNQRLKIISEELYNVDQAAEIVKSRFGASDAISSAGINLEAGRQVEQQIVNANTQLEQIVSIKGAVKNKGKNDIIPNVGIVDPTVANNINKYNELILNKKALLKNSTEKNPTVVNLTDQINILENNINQGLNNIESSQKIALNNYTKQYGIAQGRIYGAPKQDRAIRDVTRKQQTKEALYLYLLQKREETAITLGVAEAKARVIDKAETKEDSIAPKKKFSYLGALLAGLFIPFIILYLRDLLDSKIHSREDIERVLNIPIIGDIPKLEAKTDRYLIKKEDHTGIAESFRILRTNLNFILPKTDSNAGKVIFVTSTIAHEGKSLVATNLATALSHAEKKTIILGLDIRAPKIEPYLGVRGKVGITNYVINSKIKPEDLIISAPKNDYLDIVSSGDIAPNPAELLMNDRIKELFEFAKNNYEYVIVDTAAFSMVTDTLLLSQHADAFIYVIRANFLDRRMLKYVKFLFNEKRLPNMALLLNGLDQKKTYGYGYGYGYGSQLGEENKRPWWKFLS
ncbi:MAG TPA: tyrosine protein kinase [Flavobacteriaceae bacterium]|jgi:capsular exopolysaccharide synthesis family protein|nr:tyrosine protein kinase [Flavobacteriaceae bacterium]HBS11596.1 tyrosine protein kinase [Flavobacteriaceae bacterium]